MSRRAWAVLLGCAFGVLAVGLVAALVIDRGGDSAELVPGMIFSTDEGDPVDVLYGPDDEGRGCTNVGAVFYGSTVSCFDLETVDETGSYEVVIPESKRKPPLVVGVLPARANAATVSLRSTMVEAETRGRWFLASLEPGVLGPTNDASVVVRFDRR